MKKSKIENPNKDLEPFDVDEFIDGNTDAAFHAIATSYGLRNPEQIKMRILWRNIQGLLGVIADLNEPENKKLLETYQYHWRLAEKEENRRLKKAALKGLCMHGPEKKTQVNAQSDAQ